ncbi:MAG: glycolate oxidase subunit GlcF, partial [Gammaproteobacteria bacterium]|nr:glycolate oxidase subunit GlcF [Gammaproteobacteria bacterium]NNL99881.1 glycolate oxidase subunit GlcF [Gammaproteobacteria bacterium]
AAQITGVDAGPATSRRPVFVHAGCVQPAMSPAIDAAAGEVLRYAGYTPAPLAGCCGALAHHLGDHHEARRLARRNIQRWLPALQHRDARLVVTASGCLAMLRDYPRMLEDDPELQRQAAQLIERLADPADLIEARALPTLARNGETVACHVPCTRKHMFGDDARPWQVLQTLGYQLQPDTSGLNCCGSAGTYSLLQPALAERIRERKLAGLEGGDPSVIATANVGCLHHLESGSPRPVRHWVELAAEALARQPEVPPPTSVET